MGRTGQEPHTSGHDQQAQAIVLDETMEVIFKNASQKQVDDITEQLQEAHQEISDLKAYVMLKESEILLLKERVCKE